MFEIGSGASRHVRCWLPQLQGRAPPRPRAHPYPGRLVVCIRTGSAAPSVADASSKMDRRTSGHVTAPPGALGLGRRHVTPAAASRAGLVGQSIPMSARDSRNLTCTRLNATYPEKSTPTRPTAEGFSVG